MQFVDKSQSTLCSTSTSISMSVSYDDDDEEEEEDETDDDDGGGGGGDDGDNSNECDYDEMGDSPTNKLCKSQDGNVSSISYNDEIDDGDDYNNDIAKNNLVNGIIAGVDVKSVRVDDDDHHHHRQHENGACDNISIGDSEYSFNDGDITLVDDIDNLKCDPNNEAEMMFLQVVEMLRFEQEVIYKYLIFFVCIISIF